MGQLQKNKNNNEAFFNTPLIRLKRLEKEYNLKSKLYIKLESFNKAGSIKDRPAYFILKDVLSKYENPYLVCASSGNFGISLAYYANKYKIKLIVVMPDGYSYEREDLMIRLNAKVIRGNFSMSEANFIAKSLALKIFGGVFINQFENELNVLSHKLTTAIEIKEKLIPDFIVCGIGSGGTIMGISSYFKECNFKTKMVGVLPDKYPHKIEGIGAGFKSKLIEDIFIDLIYNVSYEKSKEMALKIKDLEGVRVGLSSGGAIFVGINLALLNPTKKSKILIISADDDKKYPSLSKNGMK